MNTKAAKHSDARHCDTHQRERNEQWVWIESERDSGPYGSRESTIVQVRLVATASAGSNTGCDGASRDASGDGTEKPVATIQVDSPPRTTRRGSVPTDSRLCLDGLDEGLDVSPEDVEDAPEDG